MSEVYKIEGLREAIEAIETTNAEELLKVITAIERRAVSKYTTTPLRTAIPDGETHKFKKSIGIISDGESATGLFGGVKLGRRTDSDSPPDGVILRFLEGGTKQRTTKKGYNRGKITGKRRVQPIILNSIPNIIEFFNKEFGDEIARRWEKKLKKSSL